MAKIPDQYATGGVRWTSPRQVARFDGSAMGAPGRAMQGLGQSIAQLGNSIAGAIDASGQQDMKAAKFETELKFQNLDLEIDDYMTEQTRNMPEDGSGYRETTTKHIDGRYREFFKGVPDQLKPEYDLRLRKRAVDRETNARDMEFGQRDKYHINQIGGQLEGYYSRIEQDPDSLTDNIGRGSALIERSMLPDNRKRELLQQFGRNAELRHFQTRKMQIEAKRGQDGVLVEDIEREYQALEADIRDSGWQVNEFGDIIDQPQQGGGALGQDPPINPDGSPAEGGAPTGDGTGPQSSVTPVLTEPQKQRLANVNPDVVDKFSLLQGKLDRTFNINSGFRDPARNARVGGGKRSQHIHGNAIDIDVRDMSTAERAELISEASALGFTGIGIYKNAIHLDTGAKRAWGPTYGRGSVPGWAEPAIAAHVNGRSPTATGTTTAAANIPSDLGSVSAKYESGGKGVGFISSGRADPGGKSYGIHQLSGAYSMGAFLRSPEGQAYRDAFKGSRPTTDRFNQIYRQVAAQDPDGFAKAQKAFYARTHYEPVKATAEKLGFDVQDRGVQEALFSMGVQHGKARDIVARAAKAGDFKGDPKAQIAALYGARSKYVAGLRSLPGVTKNAVLNRYKREVQDALRLAGSASSQDAGTAVADAGSYGDPPPVAQRGLVRVAGLQQGAMALGGPKDDVISEAAPPIQGKSGPRPSDVGANSEQIKIARRAADILEKYGEAKNVPMELQGELQAGLRLIHGPSMAMTLEDRSGPDTREALLEADPGLAPILDKKKKTQEEQNRIRAAYEKAGMVNDGVNRMPVVSDEEKYKDWPADLRAKKERGEKLTDEDFARVPKSPYELNPVDRGPRMSAADQIKALRGVEQQPPVLGGVNPNKEIVTILDGIPDDQPLSALPEDVRAQLDAVLPKDADKKFRLGQDTDAKASATDVVTVGEVKQAFADSLADDKRAVELADASGQMPAATSSRYRWMTPQDRAKEYRQLQIDRRNMYISAIAGEVDQVKRFGEESRDSEGRTLLDRAAGVLLPNQLDKERQKIAKARWHFNVISPLPTMPDDALDDVLETLQPTMGDDIQTRTMKAATRQEAETEIRKIREARSKDIAESVKDLPEVKIAIAQMHEVKKAWVAVTSGDGTTSFEEQANPSYSMAKGADGKASFQVQGVDKLMKQRTKAYEDLFEARIRSQEHVLSEDDNPDAPEINRIRILTRNEAKALLGFDRASSMTDSQYRQQLEKAAARAERTFGPRYAKRALYEAINRGSRNDTKKNFEARLITKMATGDDVSDADIRQYESLEQVDRIGRELDFAPAQPPAQRPGIAAGANQPTSQSLRILMQNANNPKALESFEKVFGQGSLKRALEQLQGTVTTKDLGFPIPKQQDQRNWLQQLFSQ